ncbi:MAG: 1A family penicillin-binding protein [Parcubacteria group bacterium Gr01-1014_66]|nr:MAG: 1A family penicillin-binding protein [Parcubacteria group bacterium Gr01-1014_66]
MVWYDDFSAMKQYRSIWTKKILKYVGVSLLFLGLLTAWSAYALLRDLPSPERIRERAIIESTKIYDRTGRVLLYEIHGEEKRTVVPLAEIPLFVRQATLAAEDIHFYSHDGIYLPGIARAFLTNLRKGNITQGGSTITQQLIKKVFLTDERTYTRKFKEAILAIATEKKYTKDQILEMYLNQIPYGANAYGIAAAAETYFGKDVSELSLEEAALLASLPKAPTYYSPYGSHKEELYGRKDWILARMADAGFIKTEEVDRARAREIAFVPPAHGIRAPHFVLFVREYLNEKYGEEYVAQSGLRVITTLDAKLQEHAEKAVYEGMTRNMKISRAHNAAFVAMDPKNGHILAMVGSRDYWGTSEPSGCIPGSTCRFDPHVNVATRPRQPGSAFKPFAYATAFKKGYAPETVLFDLPTEFNPLCSPQGIPQRPGAGKCYHPQNYDEKFRGPVTLRQALAQSLNVPSVQLLYLAGINDAITTAEAMGIQTLSRKNEYGLSLVLGGAEVTLLDMVSAYGVFAQEGIAHQKIPILRIERPDGSILEEQQNSQEQVLDTEIAQIMNDILSDNEARVPVFRPQSALYFPEREVAAKTGTTQNFKDAWTIGYTPSLVAGVWVGNNDNTPVQSEGASVMVAAPIWHAFMVSALADSPKETFTKPARTLSKKPALRGVLNEGPYMVIDTISKKRATPYTPPELTQEIGLGPIKSILAFVQRQDPEGPLPENPLKDPQFANWQASLDQWLITHPQSLPQAPTEDDDLHTPEKQPQITFPEVQGEEVVLTKPFLLHTQVHGEFPLREVLFFLDDELQSTQRATAPTQDFTFSLAPTLAIGSHTAKVVVYDTTGNNTTREIRITIASPPLSSSATAPTHE